MDDLYEPEYKRKYPEYWDPPSFGLESEESPNKTPKTNKTPRAIAPRKTPSKKSVRKTVTTPISGGIQDIIYEDSREDDEEEDVIVEKKAQLSFTPRIEARKMRRSKDKKSYRAIEVEKKPPMYRKGVEFGQFTENHVCIITISKFGANDPERPPTAYYSAPKSLFVDAISNAPKMVEVQDSDTHYFVDEISKSSSTVEIPDPRDPKYNGKRKIVLDYTNMPSSPL